MRLHTASEIISLARKLEADSAELYDQLAVSGTGHEWMRSCSAENRRFADQVERAYYGVISDAIESGFAFDMEADDFDLSAGATSEAAHACPVKAAIETERRIVRFYASAADQSGDLLADIPRVFKQIIRKRTARLEKLETVLRGQT